MIYINIFSIKKVSFSDLILVLSIIAVGGFNEWMSALISAAILVYLFYKCVKQGTINYSNDLLFYATALVSLSYFIVGFWAIDAGMAFIGGIKFLPIILFLILRKQEKADNANTYQIIILLSAIMVVVSSVFSIIPQFAGYFTVADRLAGFFQYPNAFAMLILISELLILQKEKIGIIDIVFLAIFLFGIIYSGSRIVFVLFIVSNIAILLFKSNKKFRLIFLASVAALLIITFIFFGDNAIVQRFLRISIFESTFVGRILYWVDALPLLLKYPFGMGYLGYNYVYPTIQTGVYSVRYVHNDFLQLFLDIGWIPTILFIVAIVKKVISNNTNKYLKITIITFCIHIFFEFDLQFLSLFFILLLLLSDEQQSVKSIKTGSLFGAVSITALLVNVYIASHLMLSFFNLNEQAAKLYPWNTQNNIALLEKETQISEADALADIILSQNKVSFVPYVVKAKVAYSNGDFNNVINYNRKILELNPFEQKYYEDYAIMLINGITRYKSANDVKSIEYCQRELKTINDELKGNTQKLSSLGKAIKDQPNTEFSEKVSEYIKRLG